ncbi:MAG: hypothetical protein OEY89_16485, partial [Gammaproteobacteria bacterium]|nr:hypothetical protein [Gammaproteobacteria bacterium]
FMTKDAVRLRYDGPALSEHSIDVNDLAPALLALGDLCTRANKKFNQNRASVKVLVNADLEQNCFEIYLELAQTIFEQAKTLLKNDDVASAKEILEWLGIIGSTAATVGLFRLLKILNGRKISSKELVKQDGKDVIKIHVEGDNNTVLVHPQTMELLEDKSTIKALKSVVKPVTKEGYDTVAFDHGNGEIESINKDEAASIIDTDLDCLFEEEEAEDESQTITAWLRVYSPVYNSTVKNWMFEYGKNHEYVDISETDIAKKALERGGALVNDMYKVKLEISQTISDSGSINNHYKIIEVLEFKPAKPEQQINLFDDE